jgi:PhnB protein
MQWLGGGKSAGRARRRAARTVTRRLDRPEAPLTRAFTRAFAAGAMSLGEPADRHYGERAGFVSDPFGNHWYIATPLGAQSLASRSRTVTPVLHLEHAAAHVEFLKRALGAVEEMGAGESSGPLRYGRLRVGDAALEIGEGAPMPGSFMLYVADPDRAYEQAIAAGATSIMPLGDAPYGRVGGVQDAAGNQWFFARPAAGGRSTEERRPPI